MRKILAGFLAASIVASVGATMSFAVSTNATFAVTIHNDTKVETAGSGGSTDEGALDAADEIPAGDVTMTIYTTAGDEFVFTSKKSIIQGGDKDKIAAAFAGAIAETAINGVNYRVTLAVDGTTKNKLNASVTPAGKVNFDIATGNVKLSPVVSSAQANGKLEIIEDASTKSSTVSAALTNGAGGVNENAGNRTMDYTQIIHCDDNGVPIPMVESKDDRNGSDGVKSGKKVYFLINDPYGNDTYFKVKTNKGKNSKDVKSIKTVTKRFSSPLVTLANASTVSGTGGVRRTYIQVEMNEKFTDDESKITFDLKVSTTSDGSDKYPEFENVDFNEDDIATVWLKNKVVSADGEFRVGITGEMLDPISNDWNEVTYYDEESDLAFLKFFADSDVDKFYAKLSTKWEHADYASYFNDQDAYIFDFTGSPKISATSRCDLQIYNPFIDEDGNDTIDPESAVIYQVIDGDLYDITDNFTYGEGDNGDMAFITRTRFLGTYIICEKTVEEAVDDTEEVPEIVPEDTTPVEVTPGNDDGGKAPANTGKYL